MYSKSTQRKDSNKIQLPHGHSILELALAMNPMLHIAIDTSALMFPQKIPTTNNKLHTQTIKNN